MRIVIEIRGGLVEEIYADAPLEALILDHDCLDDVNGDPEGQVWDAVVEPKKVWELFVNHGGASGMVPPST